MKTSPWSKIFIPIILSLVLLLGACRGEPSRYADVQKETTQRGAPGAVAKKAEQGAKFNQFFPSNVQGYNIVPAQEKRDLLNIRLIKTVKPWLCCPLAILLVFPPPPLNMRIPL